MGRTVHWEFKHRQIRFTYKTLMMQSFTPQFTLQKLLTSLQPSKKICRLGITSCSSGKLCGPDSATLAHVSHPSSTSEVPRTIRGRIRVMVILFSVCC